MVQFFLDTASLKDIDEFVRQGIADGATTNQKIVLSEGNVDFKRRILDICALVDGPVSVETTKSTVPELLAEARDYASWHKNVVVKVAMYGDGKGLQVVHQLARERIRTNMTAMMTFNQLVLAAKAGATYVSLFYNRSIEAHEDALQIIRDYATLAKEQNLSARLIVGSIRKPGDVAEAVAAGAHIITIPAKILREMAFNKRTEETIEEFDKAWEDFLAMRKEEVAKIKHNGERAEKGRLSDAPFISNRASAGSRRSSKDVA
ncbi:MAG: fructose-6-phosphate aldolase [Thaumarchaeota archaeon]|nr:fructose-6-phosphate aldolase [Nitrososphaerota archaeon]